MASTDPLEVPEVAEQPNPLEQPAASKKSYRRKYRKIMVSFEEKMRDNSALFKEEQRILDISQRLAEQTDQMLQLLVDLNSCPQIPPRLRYDLAAPGDRISTDGSLIQVDGEEEGHLDLRKARNQLQRGEIDAVRYREIEAGLLRTAAFAPGRSYSSLLDAAPPPNQSNGSHGLPSGFLSTKQEEQYLQGLDAFLDGATTNPRSHAANSLGNRSMDKTTERERETQLKNPVSVYNWLRKHQPQVFLQDNEPSTEKATRTTGSRSSTRKSTTKEAFKQEQDFYDDDGIAIEIESSSRGKRKRDNDGGYRPKGGSARGTKRRRELREDTGRSKRVKKLSVDAR
ncbi:uncharacterized protein Z518_04839 [Rhinocladiella mackenziei CBS 650.93]|uniref:IEC3 subunit of the Ino80 complex, chromatin re-modelling-domain-containing protein n=1 Tax=Rhinocladiella mackenziei CBS 650.93 TaxID=1442369 RepID=A0A0D2H8R9_9EURO|nr:uncharacterized protein Z518_04839 [Rhinocladiella mackenziei CBS 650.93]KIX06863.1 hypothetical protein Z518_04839 [Rhinocladiella mackenziei CBS 650.93]